MFSEESDKMMEAGKIEIGKETTATVVSELSSALSKLMLVMGQ